MITKTALGLALVLATVSGSLAATRPHAAAPVVPAANAYNSYGNTLRTDPDPSIRFDLKRDATHGLY